MNWKKFLKPDWRKIVIFVILMIIPIPIPLYASCKCFPAPCNCPTELMFYPIIIMILLGAISISSLLLLLVDMIVSYLLSCLIVWIYDKIKVKKK